jgi:hypothetical protein
MLTAHRPHPTTIPELIYVTSDEIPAPNNVVAKHNTKAGETWRTSHAGAKPALAEIRSVVAALATS